MRTASLPARVLTTSEAVPVEAQAHVAEAARRLDGRVRQLVEMGDPGEVICDMAAVGHVEVIVVGPTAKGGPAEPSSDQ